MSDENHSPKLFCRLRNIFHRHDKEDVRETLEDLIEEAGTQGEEVISEHEQLLLNNVLDLRDKKCCHAMVPRADIIAFHKDGTIGDLAQLMLSKGHSRIPIYGDSLDDIVGIVHIIDLAKNLLKGNINTPVKDILCRDVHFITPDMEILDLLKDMQSNKIHMSIVIDEYGGVDGLVTIEDLLEEIVGNIEDEYDYEEQHSIKPQSGGYLADARAELSEIKTATGIDLQIEDDGEETPIETLGGYVFQLTQHIPAKGEVITNNEGIIFKIIDVDPLRIKKILLIKPSADTADTPNE
ncbi:MAG: HlyC/CorC family transporter [Alphaproteobacteria bacterium]|nr:HlyC/CorC family transporter [Alphaproteobacteria bacterium]